ncbi:EAL domain-containing protein [Roseomonas sp. WA12]
MEPQTNSPEDDQRIADLLETAMRRGAIRPAFQPIVQMKDGTIASFEVLARWTDELLGPIPPARFIPIAENGGHMAALTEHLIRTACAAALEWGGDFRLAFNISPLHFQDATMPGLFEETVRSTGFPLERTQVEITETAVIGDIEAARATADLLRGKGVRIVLDDFGTGHSSLTRLQALPFDEIKVDRSFVRSMGESRDSRKIVGAVISLGQSLGSAVVAEGVETESQAETLSRLGCDFAQGWLYGRPVPAEEVPAVLRARGEAAQEPLHRHLSADQRLGKLEAAYAAAPTGLLFLDRTLRVLGANRHCASQLGLEARAMLGRPIGEIEPAIAAHAQSDLDRARRGEPIPPRLLPLPAARRTGLLAAAPARDDSGELLGLSLVITELPGPA